MIWEGLEERCIWRTSEFDNYNSEVVDNIIEIESITSTLLIVEAEKLREKIISKGERKGGTN